MGLLIITYGLHRLSQLVIPTLITVISGCNILIDIDFKSIIIVELILVHNFSLKIESNKKEEKANHL